MGRAAIYRSRGGAPQGVGEWTMGSGLLRVEGRKTRGIMRRGHCGEARSEEPGNKDFCPRGVGDLIYLSIFSLAGHVAIQAACWHLFSRPHSSTSLSKIQSLLLSASICKLEITILSHEG